MKIIPWHEAGSRKEARDKGWKFVAGVKDTTGHSDSLVAEPQSLAIRKR